MVNSNFEIQLTIVVKQPSIDETKTKELILGRTVSGSQEKSSATSEKPGFGSSQNKGGLRYAQPKKNIGNEMYSDCI